MSGGISFCIFEQAAPETRTHSRRQHFFKFCAKACLPQNVESGFNLNDLFLKWHGFAVFFFSCRKCLCHFSQGCAKNLFCLYHKEGIITGSYNHSKMTCGLCSHENHNQASSHPLKVPINTCVSSLSCLLHRVLAAPVIEWTH